MLGISQRDKNITTAIQTLLISWIVDNDEYGEMWTSHPAGYKNLREFLHGVGVDSEGSKLSEPMVSSLARIGMYIIPHAKAMNIDIKDAISKHWSKFFDMVAPLTRAVKIGDKEKFAEIIDDIYNLDRMVLRAKYRSSKAPVIGRSDSVIAGNTAYIVIATSPDKVEYLLARISRWVEMAPMITKSEIAWNGINMEVRLP